MRKKWRTWKGILKPRGYDPSITIAEIVTQQTNNDDTVNPIQFKELVKRWFTSNFQAIPILDISYLVDGLGWPTLAQLVDDLYLVLGGMRVALGRPVVTF
ncbi:hypothetical protein R6Q59_010254 [Mikania micrantha]